MNYIISNDKQRVFIGIPIDKRSQQHINGLLKAVNDSQKGIRWVPENNRHLTLAFLGDIPVSRVGVLLRQFDKTYQGEACFQYGLSALTRFPNSKGRIVALTGEPEEPLNNIFQITLRLLQENDFEFDNKRFRPHVTLARIRNPKRLKTSFYQPVDITLEIKQVTLYQSTLTEYGSIYSPLKETYLT